MLAIRLFRLEASKQLIRFVSSAVNRVSILQFHLLSFKLFLCNRVACEDILAESRSIEIEAVSLSYPFSLRNRAINRKSVIPTKAADIGQISSVYLTG